MANSGRARPLRRGSRRADRGEPRRGELEETASLLEATGTRYANTHLAPPPARSAGPGSDDRSLSLPRARFGREGTG